MQRPGRTNWQPIFLSPISKPNANETPESQRPSRKAFPDCRRVVAATRDVGASSDPTIELRQRSDVPAMSEMGTKRPSVNPIDSVPRMPKAFRANCMGKKDRNTKTHCSEGSQVIRSQEIDGTCEYCIESPAISHIRKHGDVNTAHGTCKITTTNHRNLS